MANNPIDPDVQRRAAQLLGRLNVIRPVDFPVHAAPWFPTEVEALERVSTGTAWAGAVVTAVAMLREVERIAAATTAVPAEARPRPQDRPEDFRQYQDTYADAHRWLSMLVDGKDVPGDAQWGTGVPRPQPDE
jgi:hypothetical protein